jgi:hypothetical protein
MQMFEKLQKFHAKDKIPFQYDQQFQTVKDLLAQACAEADKAEAGSGGNDDEMEQ